MSARPVSQGTGAPDFAPDEPSSEVRLVARPISGAPLFDPSRPPKSIRHQRRGAAPWWRRAINRSWALGPTAFAIFADGGVPELVGDAIVPLRAAPPLRPMLRVSSAARPEAKRAPATLDDVIATLVRDLARGQHVLCVVVRHPSADGGVALVRLPFPSKQAEPRTPSTDDDFTRGATAARSAVADLLDDAGDEKEDAGRLELAAFARECAAALRARGQVRP